LEELERRKFLAKAGKIAAGLGGLYLAATIPGCGKPNGGSSPQAESEPATPDEIPSPQPSATPPPAGLIVVKGSDQANMVSKGLEAWGGLSALAIAGKKVLIKVNGAFARPPEDATTTNPQLVAEVIRQCLQAGASKVTVYDHILQDLADQTFQANGITPAAKAAGAEIVVYAVRKPGSARTVQIPNAKALPSAAILNEIFNADMIINMPKAKHHGGAKLSLSMKNFIGTLQDMGKVHEIDLDRGIAEISTVIKPALVIMDATNILLDHGPGGPGKVANPGQVIIGVDPVAIDAYACGLFGMAPTSIGYIVQAQELGVGTSDFKSLGVREVSA
jgi:uncharacterized protein (DUF362 family)